MSIGFSILPSVFSALSWVWDWDWAGCVQHGNGAAESGMATGPTPIVFSAVLESQGGHDHGAKPGRGGVASCPVTSAMSSSLCRLGSQAHFPHLTISLGPDLCGQGGLQLITLFLCVSLAQLADQQAVGKEGG